MVYGLRYYYRPLGMNKKAIALPSLKGNTKLPVILNQSELKEPDIDTLIKKKAPQETVLQRFQRLTGINPCQCPVCKTGRMVSVRELPRIRAPDWSSILDHSNSLI